MVERGTTIEVKCRCGQEIAKYEKVGRGRLQKMYLDMVLEDQAGVLTGVFENDQEIFCPGCEKRIATVKMIHGRPAAKINQGAIKPIRT